MTKSLVIIPKDQSTYQGLKTPLSDCNYSLTNLTPFENVNNNNISTINNTNQGLNISSVNNDNSCLNKRELSNVIVVSRCKTPVNVEPQAAIGSTSGFNDCNIAPLNQEQEIVDLNTANCPQIQTIEPPENVVVNSAVKNGSVTVNILPSKDDSSQKNDSLNNNSDIVTENQSKEVLAPNIPFIIQPVTPNQNQAFNIDLNTNNTNVNKQQYVPSIMTIKLPNLEKETHVDNKKILLVQCKNNLSDKGVSNIQLIPDTSQMTHVTPSLSTTPIMSTGVPPPFLQGGKIIRMNMNPQLVLLSPQTPLITSGNFASQTKLRTIAPKPCISESHSSIKADKIPLLRKNIVPNIVKTQAKRPLPPVPKISTTPKKSSINGNNILPPATKKIKISHSEESNIPKAVELINEPNKSANNGTNILDNKCSNNDENETENLNNLSTSTLVHNSDIIECVTNEQFNIIDSVMEPENNSDDRLAEMICSINEAGNCQFSPPPSPATAAENLLNTNDTVQENELRDTENIQNNDSTLEDKETLNNDISNVISANTSHNQLLPCKTDSIPTSSTSTSSKALPEISFGSSNYSITALCMSSRPAENIENVRTSSNVSSSSNVDLSLKIIPKSSSSNNIPISKKPETKIVSTVSTQNSKITTTQTPALSFSNSKITSSLPLMPPSLFLRAPSTPNAPIPPLSSLSSIPVAKISKPSLQPDFSFNTAVSSSYHITSASLSSSLPSISSTNSSLKTTPSISLDTKLVLTPSTVASTSAIETSLSIQSNSIMSNSSSDLTISNSSTIFSNSSILPSFAHCLNSNTSNSSYLSFAKTSQSVSLPSTQSSNYIVNDSCLFSSHISSTTLQSSAYTIPCTSFYQLPTSSNLSQSLGFGSMALTNSIPTSFSFSLSMSTSSNCNDLNQSSSNFSSKTSSNSLFSSNTFNSCEISGNKPTSSLMQPFFSLPVPLPPNLPSTDIPISDSSNSTHFLTKTRRSESSNSVSTNEKTGNDKSLQSVSLTSSSTSLNSSSPSKGYFSASQLGTSSKTLTTSQSQTISSSENLTNTNKVQDNSKQQKENQNNLMEIPKSVSSHQTNINFTSVSCSTPIFPTSFSILTTESPIKNSTSIVSAGIENSLNKNILKTRSNETTGISYSVAATDVSIDKNLVGQTLPCNKAKINIPFSNSMKITENKHHALPVVSTQATLPSINENNFSIAQKITEKDDRSQNKFSTEDANLNFSDKVADKTKQLQTVNSTSSTNSNSTSSSTNRNDNEISSPIKNDQPLSNIMTSLKSKTSEAMAIDSKKPTETLSLVKNLSAVSSNTDKTKDTNEIKKSISAETDQIDYNKEIVGRHKEMLKFKMKSHRDTHPQIVKHQSTDANSEKANKGKTISMKHPLEDKGSQVSQKDNQNSSVTDKNVNISKTIRSPETSKESSLPSTSNQFSQTRLQTENQDNKVETTFQPMQFNQKTMATNEVVENLSVQKEVNSQRNKITEKNIIRNQINEPVLASSSVLSNQKEQVSSLQKNKDNQNRTPQTHQDETSLQTNTLLAKTGSTTNKLSPNYNPQYKDQMLNQAHQETNSHKENIHHHNTGNNNTSNLSISQTQQKQCQITATHQQLSSTVHQQQQSLHHHHHQPQQHLQHIHQGQHNQQQVQQQQRPHQVSNGTGNLQMSVGGVALMKQHQTPQINALQHNNNNNNNNNQVMQQQSHQIVGDVTTGMQNVNNNNNKAQQPSGLMQHTGYQHHFPPIVSASYIQPPPTLDYSSYYRKPTPHSPRGDMRHQQCYNYKQPNSQYQLPGTEISDPSATAIVGGTSSTNTFMDSNVDEISSVGRGVVDNSVGSSDHVRSFSVSQLVSHCSESRKTSISSSNSKDNSGNNHSEEKIKDTRTKSGNRKSENKSRSNTSGSTSSSSNNNKSSNNQGMDNNSRRRSPARGGGSNASVGSGSNNSNNTLQGGSSISPMWGNSKSNSIAVVGHKQNHNYSTEALLSTHHHHTYAGRAPGPSYRTSSGGNNSTPQNYIMGGNHPAQMYQTGGASVPPQMKNLGHDGSFMGYPGQGNCNPNYNLQLHPQPAPPGSFTYGGNMPPPCPPYMTPGYPYHPQNLPPPTSGGMFSGDISGHYPRLCDFPDQTNFPPTNPPAFPPLPLDPQDMCGGGGSSMGGHPTPSMGGHTRTHGHQRPIHAGGQGTSSAGVSSTNTLHSGGSSKRGRYPHTSDGNMTGGILEGPPAPPLAHHLPLHSFTPPCDDSNPLVPPGSLRQSQFLDQLITPQYPHPSSQGSSGGTVVASSSGTRTAPLLGAPASSLRMMERHHQQVSTPGGPLPPPLSSSSLSNFNLTSIIPEIDGKGPPGDPSPRLPPSTPLLPPGGLNSSFPPTHPPQMALGVGLNSSLPLPPSTFSSINF